MLRATATSRSLALAHNLRHRLAIRVTASPIPPFRQPHHCTNQPKGRMATIPSAADPDRPAVNQRQREIFNNPAIISKFTEQLPQDVEQRLERIAQAVPGLGPESRIIDVGTGTGCLIPHFHGRGIKDILAVDLAENMLQQLRATHGATSTLGNEPGLQTWCGDVVDLPAYMGPADAFFFNSVFGNVASQREALLRSALLLRPGGYIVLSHAMGRQWHLGLREKDPTMVPHELPQRQALEELVWDLPLEVVDYVDEPDLYLATLQVPLQFKFDQAPLHLEGLVVKGFGRGSAQMGVPTANIDPVPLADTLKHMRRGVYFGWACLDAPAGGSWTDADRAVHKMVMNVGKRPTVSDGNEGVLETVEVHILHKYPDVFYGQHLRVVALGYLRPEMRFAGGVKELVARIWADIGTAKAQLDDPALAAHQQDPRLQRRTQWCALAGMHQAVPLLLGFDDNPRMAYICEAHQKETALRLQQQQQAELQQQRPQQQQPQQVQPQQQQQQPQQVYVGVAAGVSLSKSPVRFYGAWRDDTWQPTELLWYVLLGLGMSAERLGDVVLPAIVQQAALVTKVQRMAAWWAVVATEFNAASGEHSEPSDHLRYYAAVHAAKPTKSFTSSKGARRWGLQPLRRDKATEAVGTVLHAALAAAADPDQHQLEGRPCHAAGQGHACAGVTMYVQAGVTLART